MILTEVSSRKDKKDFHKLPFIIYKHIPEWIPHIKQEVENVFNPKKNKFFKHGEATRFIVKNKNKNLIGRIAVFINHKKANTEKQPTGGIGFFECIDDQKTADLLFNHAKKWLKERSIEAMDGPINFGERNKYWGLLIKGFEHSPVYGNNYNPEYYIKLFENYGFKNYFEQYMYSKNIHDEIPEKFQERFNLIKEDKNLTFRHIKKKELSKFTEDFRTIYNAAWVTHDNFKKMSLEQSKSIMRKIKPIMEEELIWFGYYNNKPISFLIILPEINQIFKKFNGNLNLINKLRFLYYKWKGTCTHAFGVAVGVSPEFQKKGYESGMIHYAREYLQKKNRYTKIILTWIGSFNPKMLSIMRSLNSPKHQILITYRYLFDRNLPFERCPKIKK